MAFAVTLWFTALQQHVPPHVLSRVSAYDWLGSTALRPVGLVAAGPIATAVSVRTTLLGAATLVVVSSLALLSLPSVRSLRRREDTEATQAPS
ncbi:MAG TPA: hypothetical protein VG276_04610 [Actinomycetes bacterium]|jgi:hypothetical protein|nr:hypothetical protein [Actinomycetes bacterium]